jgi:hypothetical protein
MLLRTSHIKLKMKEARANSRAKEGLNYGTHHEAKQHYTVSIVCPLVVSNFVPEVSYDFVSLCL